MMPAIKERVEALTQSQREALQAKLLVLAKQNAPATRLIAFVQLRAGQSANPDELKAHLAERLPAHMLPASVHVIDTMPLTPNGKIDRRTLAGMDVAPAQNSAALVAPRDEYEQAIAGIWSKLLGINDVSVHDDFFELGGHSLLVTRAIARINDAFGLSMPVRVFFDRPTIAGQAVYVRQQKTRDLQASHEERDTFEI